MTRRRATRLMLALLVGGLVLADGSQVLAQMGPGMMGGSQTSPMPMQQMAEVVKQMADRLASGKALDAEKAERLRGLAEQLIGATSRMAGGMGGGMMGPSMMGGGMMRQGAEQMGDLSRTLAQISELLRAP